MFTEEQKNLLGLSDKENAVLQSINSSNKSLSSLSLDTCIPRPTVYLLINKLYKRGLVKCRKQGSRFYYQTITTETLACAFRSIADSLEPKVLQELNISSVTTESRLLEHHQKIPRKWFSIFRKVK